jgi:hypothetical protein
MSTRTIFEDENGNELQCYLNDALLVYISVDQKDDHTGYGGGFITLERDDIGKLIQILQDAKQVMDAEAESLEPPPISTTSDSLN